MLAYLSAAAMLLLAVRSAAQVTVAVDDVTVGLTDTKSTQGERYTLSSSLHELSITCRFNSTTAQTTGNIAWRLASSSASITDARTPFTQDIDAGGLSGKSVLKIKYPVKSDITAYVCTVNQTANATGKFISLPLLSVSVNGIVEYDSSQWPGENLAIKCRVDGTPVGDIRWSKSVDPTFNVTNNNTIYMYSVSYDNDRGYVTCTSTNSQGTNTATVFLRIKSQTNYLAPLVAVFVEIVIMLIITVGYELYDTKRRRTMVADGMKDQ